MTDGEFYVLDSVGVLIIRGLLPSEQVRYVNERIDRELDGTLVAKFPIMEIDEVFMELMAHPRIVQACTRIIGDRFRFDHSFGLQQPAARPNLHGGPQVCQSSCFYHGGVSTAGIAWAGRMSVGFALTHQSRKTGGFAYIPGSHKSSYLLHGSTVLQELLGSNFDHECIQVPTLCPGDVCIFPDCLVHGTAPWNESSIRRALYYMYSPGYMAWRPYSEIEHYVHLARTPLQRQLLRPPYVASFSESRKTIGDNQWRRPNQ